MRSENLQLVIPKKLHETYTVRQKDWLMNLEDFITLMKRNEQ